MQEFYLIIALLTAGISLTIGFISFFLGLRHKNKTDLFFGLMCLSLFVFFLLPPVGFIIHDQAPYPIEILVKRIFNYAYYGLMPWFTFYYTVRQNKKIPILISLGVVLSYIVMAMTEENLPRPMWVWSSLILFAANFFYGLVCGGMLYRNERAKATKFLIAIFIYGVLLLLTALNQFDVDFMDRVFHVKLFFSIHLHALFFIIIIGLELMHKINERYLFEKRVQSKERRWQSLVQHAPVFIMELDVRGNIRYINQYGGSLLGYSTPEELTGCNWFESPFIPEVERKERKQFFLETLSKKEIAPYFVKIIQNKKCDTLTITWTHFLTYSEEGEVGGMICVGINTTDEENAKDLINQLKLELEKEKIIFPDDYAGTLSQDIIGKSEAIRYAIDKANQVAKTNAPVLLEGETGVGKELIADLIHKSSLRNHAPIIKVNCGALPKELIEDELFGHEKGAFTSAIQSRKGRFELADGGTIFLDEIGELPLEMQPKLLRVLQNGEYERIGGQKTIKVDVRIIAATNRDLAQEVSRGNFRDDLFYRLNVFPITIPPLRKRKEDLPLLINHFINTISQNYHKQPDQISKADMQRLMEHPWPGNVRELKNVIERSVIASEGNTLKLEWSLREASEAASESTLEQVERHHIIKIMETCHWKINGENGAAEKLNMHPNTLRSKMKKLGISRPVKDIL